MLVNLEFRNQTQVVSLSTQDSIVVVGKAYSTLCHRSAVSPSLLQNTTNVSRVEHRSILASGGGMSAAVLGSFFVAPLS